MTNEETITIPKSWLSTLNKDGYFQKFLEIWGEQGGTYEEAFYELEDNRQKYHLPEQYEYFYQFKNAFYYWHRKNRAKVENSTS